jgi:hypothetical protein
MFFPENKCLSKYVTYLINIMTENTTNVPLQVQMYCQWYIVLLFLLAILVHVYMKVEAEGS